ncbi:hypothetical protein [Aliarcobacter skirrowii]|uniref:hypothetical protein n=1 Tax=Aliarcobacter skirrowii TaxID=28200 RepID=UPI0029B285F3|nr:hypothetical protein [Aliarcobacter skirrowii]MDX4028352.1 hypothetical protein [Aliarcobacter skirrowii]
MFLNDIKGVKIVKDSGKEFILSFASKYELKHNSFLQDQLKYYHSANSPKKIDDIKCLCNDVDMACKNTSYYFLANLPNNSHKHRTDCIYFNHQEELVDKDDKYKKNIFEKTKLIDFSRATKKEIEDEYIKENHRINTYYNFCRDLLSDAMIKAFHIKNKEIKNREDITYPNYNLFLNCLDSLCGKNSLLKDESIKNSLADYHSFYYGIVDDKFISKLATGQNSYEIVLPVVKKNYSNNNKTFMGYSIENKKCNIKHYTLKSAAELVKIFENYVNTPYFFTAVLKHNKNAPSDVVRLFLKPIFYDKEYLVFVDSGYERLYAKKLIENKIPFFKPFLNSCYYKLRTDFTNYMNDKNESKKAFLQYLPDFIEFSKDKIEIVEVSGYDNLEYLRLLDRKIKHYDEVSKNSNNLYGSKIVDGSLL